MLYVVSDGQRRLLTVGCPDVRKPTVALTNASFRFTSIRKLSEPLRGLWRYESTATCPEIVDYREFIAFEHRMSASAIRCLADLLPEHRPMGGVG